MAKVLQALLLIAGFCAPVLAAFAMESGSSKASLGKEIFLENTPEVSSSVETKSTGQVMTELTADTNKTARPSHSRGANQTGLQGR